MLYHINFRHDLLNHYFASYKSSFASDTEDIFIVMKLVKIVDCHVSNGDILHHKIIDETIRHAPEHLRFTQHTPS